MNFIDLIDDYYTKSQCHKTAPGFVERIIFVQRSAAHLPNGERPVSVPFFVTDLGVRKDRGANEFYAENLKIIEARPSDPSCDLELLKNYPLENVAPIIDGFLVLTGNYEVASKAIISRHSEILRGGSYAAVLYSGVVLAAVGDVASIPLLERAIEIAPSQSASVMAGHRAAAAEIKRFNSRKRGIRRLEGLRHAVCTEFKSPEKYSLLGVIDNLIALGHLMDGDRRAAWEAELSALSNLSRKSGYSIVANSRRLRYLSQVNINLAQLMIGDGQLRKAADTLENNVHCQRSSDYLSEALTVAGYAWYLLGENSKSINHLLEAESLIAAEASPTRLRLVRKMLISCFYKSGEHAKAETYFHRLADDPLGFQV